ncbi:GNAT family N-acetyltransferase [Helicobacter monodelphidis]|uniref:GNAT family N-acetyltransferase n=1 Tax=Helicobacter sp. 15-1451 TaxID=2004995 RepID=UPI00215C7B8E|nr:GNAT family N-acetyltransferase [Helicobacter sp. 15-1451]
MLTMQELDSKQELAKLHIIARQLRPHLSQEEFIERVFTQKEKMGYRLFGFLLDNEYIGMCGVMPFEVLYHTQCLYICDFVITDTLRGKGFGAISLSLIEKWAKEAGYKELELSSSFPRTAAHHFYECKMNYDKTGFVFKKTL